MSSSSSSQAEKEIRIHSHDPLNQLKANYTEKDVTAHGSSSSSSSSSDWQQNLSNILCGGLAGILAKSAVAPVERLKIMFQVTNEAYSLRKFPSILRHIINTDGLLALWKGNGAAVIRVFPYSGVQFATFDFLRMLAMKINYGEIIGHRNDQQLPHHVTMLCGGTAAAFSSICTYPLDIARVRLAVIPKGVDSKPFRVFRYIGGWYSEGGIRAVYRGIVPTLIGVIPYGGIAFTTNAAGKRFVRETTQEEPKTWHKLVCGAVAGLVAQSITYPLEVVRRRMQTTGVVSRHDMKALYDSPGANKVKPIKNIGDETSMMGCVRGVLKEGGYRALFKGLSLNYIKGPIAISISFVSYDIFKTMMHTEGI